MDSMDIVKMIKKAAIEAVNASKPANMVFGKVISTSPLQIQVEQKMILTKAQLVLSRNVTDYQVYLSDDNDTFVKYYVKNALKKDEKVVMFQVAGGQQYVVIDRLGGSV